MDELLPIPPYDGIQRGEEYSWLEGGGYGDGGVTRPYKGVPPGLKTNSFWAQLHGEPQFYFDPKNPPTVEQVGPPGSLWSFTSYDLTNAQYGTEDEDWLRLARRRIVIVGDGFIWPVPDVWEAEVDWIRATIVADMPGAESMEHTVNIVAPNGGEVPGDTDELTDAANAVRDAWADFVTTAVDGQGRNLRGYLSGVAYQHVRVQRLHQTVAYVNGADNKGKVTQIGPTVLSGPFDNLTAMDDVMLPHEVACALTLRTRAAQSGGVSHGRRNRGRLYLGGLSTRWLQGGSSGLFRADVCEQVAQNFGEQFIAPLFAGGLQVTIISKVGLIGHQVTSVSAGVVPDAQRRRRRSLSEARETGWSIP